ncbi:MAG: DUF2339 domain-containing protein [Planctomycetota bacterium]
MRDEPDSAGEPSALVVGRLLKRLAELERRVEVLESGEPVDSEEPALVEPIKADEPPVMSDDEVVDEPVALAPVAAEPPPLATPPLPPQPPQRPATNAEPFRMSPLSYEPPAPPRAPVDGGTLEQTIGLKLAGWIGALVVVVGAAMGVKFAHDAGWFGKTPPELRMVLLALAGFGLIGAGEWVYRKVNVLSAVGLFAAGIALLFVVSYTGYGFLDVYSQTTAFVLMAGTALIGAGVAARGRLVSIAIVALLGGHLTPLILGGEVDSLVPLLAHLLMLLVIGLALSVWGNASKWWCVRWFVLATTALWFLALTLTGKQMPTVFAFALANAALLLAEQAASAWRARDSSTAGRLLFAQQSATLSTLVVGGLSLVTVVRFEVSVVSAGWLLGYAAVLAGACVALRRSPALALVAKIFVSLAMVLVIASVPIALGGPAVVLVWSALAVGFAVVAVRLPSVIALVAAVVTWLAAVVHVILGITDTGPAPVRTDIALNLFALDWPTWVLLSAVLMLTGWAIGVLVTMFPAPEDDLDKDVLDRAGQGLVGAGTFVGAAASVSGLPAAAGTSGLLVIAWLLAALDIVRPRVMALVTALVVVAIAAAKWAGVDLLAQRLSDGWTSAQLGYLPVFNPILLLGTLIAGTAVGVVVVRRNRVLGLMRGGTLTPGAVLGGAALLIGFVVLGLCIEADRVVEAWRPDWTLQPGPSHTRQLAFTLLGGLGLLAWFGVVLWRVREPGERRHWLGTSAVVPVVIAVKFLLIDVIASRLFDRGWGVGMPVVNLETAVAVVVMAGLLVWLVYLARGRATGAAMSRAAAPLGLAALMVGLIVGGCEVWRFTQVMGFSGVASQVALSAWSAVFAIGTIVAGFGVGSGRAITGLRHFGLVLLAVTCVKVFIVDLATVSAGWRTVSFIVLGLFLLATSVVYGRFSPKLLGRHAESLVSDRNT